MEDLRRVGVVTTTSSIQKVWSQLVGEAKCEVGFVWSQESVSKP